MNKKLAFLGLFVIAAMLSLTGASCAKGSAESAESVKRQSEKVTVYKSPSCGCCVQYVAYLRRKGFEVEVVSTDDIDSIKQKHNIPYDMQSCHTSEIGEYFVEGHVPIEAIDKLLAKKPNIDGITLPGMPPSSPGMPGQKRGDFVIRGLVEGAPQEFMII